MKNNFLTLICLLLFSLFLYSCTDNQELPSNKKGVPLRMAIDFGTSTRLAELPGTDAMAEDNFGLKNVGLYIYYSDEYESGDLSAPYIRNMEFTVENGELLAVGGTGEERQVYIYDRMTIVAFYPYNAEMSLKENWFEVKADEENYPITRKDYSEQLYIPYRAQTTTDPSVAYYTTLTFVPKHTYKVEVVVVAGDAANLPTAADVQILPANDPVTTPDVTLDGKREKWWDIPNEFTNDGTGSDVQQYITYIWTHAEDRNPIKRGDILLQSDELILIASQDLTPVEDRVYRYGYNMSTGEIFIPTSSRLVYDQTTLSELNGSSNTSAYQVCDITMTGNWKPISMYNTRYDGGGHRIENMVINSTDTEVGLFSHVQGNSTVANVHLVNPQITVNSDNAYVGALVGRLNTPMTEEQKEELIGNLPPGLSPIVREALIREILETAGDSDAKVVACKIEEPEITVNGTDPRVGTLVGQAGNKNEAGSSMSRIWDTAVIGGSLNVNTSNPANNENAYVGGFVGLNEGYIGRSYTTTSDINAQANGTDAQGNPVVIDKFTGFAYMGDEFTPAEGGLIETSYSQLTDGNGGVQQFPSWPTWNTYTGNWPVEITGWLGSPGTSFWYNLGTPPDTYPILQWERK